MTIGQNLGKFGGRSGRCEYLTLSFSPLSAPLRSRWRNHGLSADFLGDYVTTFLLSKGDMAAGESRQNEIRHAVTYIANELLDNAMKYHQRDVDIPIGIRVELNSDGITVSASNGIGLGQAQRYKEFVKHLLEGDAGDLLLRQQEESARCSQLTASRAGLLTMIADYGAKLGWRFERHPAHARTMTVTTSAVLPLKDVPGESA